MSPNTVHQPLRPMSSCGRNDVMNRPRVGSVHRIASTIAMLDAHGLDRRRRALAERLARPPRGGGIGVLVMPPGGATGSGAVAALIGPPRQGAAGARCRR